MRCHFQNPSRRWGGSASRRRRGGDPRSFLNLSHHVDDIDVLAAQAGSGHQLAQIGDPDRELVAGKDVLFGNVFFECGNVILFIRPTAQEATTVKEILRIFGEASGLQTNLAKCSITPIFDGEDNLQELANILGCQVQPFPIRYLGLPLSTKRLPKAHL